MSNDQQRPNQPGQPEWPVPAPSPEGGWGGEYDGDATAFIQLPGNLPGPHQSGYAAHGGTPDPLAAPGTGQGWAPPPIDPAAQAQTTPSPTPPPTTDPAAPGQWTLPFAGHPADPAPEAPGNPGDFGDFGAQPSPPQGVAAALGQGAAAALAGSHEARGRQRRPHEEGQGHAVPQASADAEDGTPGAPGDASVPGTDWNAAPAPGATGQWSIPFAAAGSPDDSGEYLAAPPAPEPPAPQPSAPPPAPEQPAGPVPPQEAVPPQDPDAARAPEGAEIPEAAGAPQVPAPEAPDPQTPDVPQAPAPEAPEPPVADAPVPEASAVDSEHPHVSYVLRVNGVDRPVTDAWIGESLLYVLRERLGLAGAKDGCAQGECGACSVQVDGRLVASCLVPAATTAGSEIRTVEGLAENGTPCDVQRALAACGAVQCGFCVPGMAMTLYDLLEGNHAPTELEARQAISGNLCRCSGYRGVLDAVRMVVAEREAAAAALAEAREAEENQAQDRAEGAGNAAGELRIRIPHQAGPATGGPPPQHRPPHDHHLPQDGGAQ